MPNITLICTVHEEKGVCTISALSQILERARPEVIFLEIPPSLYAQYFEEKTKWNLESKTVNRYLETHSVDLMPVDVFDVPNDFFEQNGLLHRKVESVSSEYRRLVDWHSQYVGQYGFAYLNSKYCSDLWLELNASIKAVVEHIGDEHLSETYDQWKDVIEHRDREMTKNIQKYAEEHEFDRGVFLVGAAHRSSIVKKIHMEISESVIWNYDNYEKFI